MRLTRTYLLSCGLIAGSSGAFAFGGEVHEWLAGAAFAKSPEIELNRRLPAAEKENLAEFRRWLYEAGSNHTEPEVRALFRSRFPRLEHFDSWAFKEWLMLDPSAEVWGIDRAPRGRLSVREAWSSGSRHPDEDRRNRNRYLRDKHRRVRVDPTSGEPLPYDPDILLMGGAAGRSSQSHAHCQLVRVRKTNDPEVLRVKPWLFALPPDLRTYAADLAQHYTDLASLAEFWGGPGHDWLVHELQGNAWHHIADAGYQLHVVQVGSHEVYRDARRRVMLGKIKAFFLLADAPPTAYEHGRSTVANLREFGAEMLDARLFGREEVATQIQAVLAAPMRGDPQLPRDLALVLKQELPGLPRAQEAAPHMPAWRKPFARAITHALASRSARESAALSRSLIELGSERLRGVGFSYDPELHDPDEFVDEKRASDELALAAFYELEGKAFRRIGEAIRHHRALCDEVTGVPGVQEREFRASDIVARLVLTLHAYHKRVRARRDDPALASRIAQLGSAQHRE